MTTDEIRGSATYRAEVRGRLGVAAAGRQFAAEAAMQMLVRGGNAADAGVAAIFAAAVTEISHFGLGGEVPIILYLADRKEVVVINGQGVAPAAASTTAFGDLGIPANGPSAGTVPAVVDALSIVLAEFGTLSLNDVMAPAISLADGFPWYEFLTYYLTPELENIRRYPSGARVYLQGPEGRIPTVGSVFRQSELASTLRALVDEERRNLSKVGAPRSTRHVTVSTVATSGSGSRRPCRAQEACSPPPTWRPIAAVWRGRPNSSLRPTDTATRCPRRGSGDRGRSCCRRSRCSRVLISWGSATTAQIMSTP